MVVVWQTPYRRAGRHAHPTASQMPLGPPTTAEPDHGSAMTASGDVEMGR